MKDVRVFTQELQECFQFGLTCLFRKEGGGVNVNAKFWLITTTKSKRFTYRADLGQQRLLGLTEERFALDRCDGFWVQLTHGLPCQPCKTNGNKGVISSISKCKGSVKLLPEMSLTWR